MLYNQGAAPFFR